MAGLLNQLTFTDVALSTRAVAVDPSIKRRNKMLEAIDLQIAICDAAADGKQVMTTGTKYVDGPDGRVKQEFERPARSWARHAGDKSYIVIKYGNKDLPIAGSKNIIEVNAKVGMKATLELLRAAAEAGELDKAMAAVASTMGRGKKAA